MQENVKLRSIYTFGKENDSGYYDQWTQADINEFKRVFHNMLDFEGFEKYIEQQKELSKRRRQTS